MLSSAFLMASTSTTSLRGSITRPAHSLSTLRLGVALAAQDSLPAVPSALAGRGCYPRGFSLRFQLMASSSAGGRCWRTRKTEGREDFEFLIPDLRPDPTNPSRPSDLPVKNLARPRRNAESGPSGGAAASEGPSRPQAEPRTAGRRSPVLAGEHPPSSRELRVLDLASRAGLAPRPTRD